MSNDKPMTGLFHNAETGETITRALTAEEIAQLPEPGESSTVTDE